MENHYPDAGHHPDRHRHGAVNEARSPRQHKHEVKTPAASEKNEGRVICLCIDHHRQGFCLILFCLLYIFSTFAPC